MIGPAVRQKCTDVSEEPTDYHQCWCTSRANAGLQDDLTSSYPEPLLFSVGYSLFIKQLKRRTIQPANRKK